MPVCRNTSIPAFLHMCCVEKWRNGNFSISPLLHYFLMEFPLHNSSCGLRVAVSSAIRNPQQHSLLRLFRHTSQCRSCRYVGLFRPTDTPTLLFYGGFIALYRPSLAALRRSISVSVLLGTPCRSISAAFYNYVPSTIYRGVARGTCYIFHIFTNFTLTPIIYQ